MENYNNYNNSYSKLDPNFITGLTDAEGCFSVSVYKNNKCAKVGVSANLEFTIRMSSNEIELLKMVKLFFGCGRLYHYKDNTVRFRIKDFSSIKNILLPHFLKYPLRGTKYLDFLSFEEASSIFDNKKHLTEEGINKLYLLKNGMNNQREFSKLEYYAPNHTKESNIGYIPINGHYVNGFIAGDGCLALNLSKKNFCIMSLRISQHDNNKLLMISIAKYFKSPSKVYRDRSFTLQVVLSGIQL